MNIVHKFIQQYKNMNIVAKASLWFVFCNIIQQGMSIITTPVFTRILTTDEYGIVTIYSTWLSIMLIFVTLQICYAPLNNAMIKYPKEKNQFISSMQCFLLFSSAVWALIFISLNHQLSNLLSLPRIAVILIIFHVFSSASMSLWVAYQRFEYHYMKLVMVTILYALISTVLGIIMVLLMKNGWLARILSMIISQGIFGISLCCINLFKGKTFYSTNYWKYSIRFGITLLPNSFCSLILNQADRLVVQKTCGDTAVAQYGLAYSIGTLTNLVKDALSHAFVPWFYKKLDTKEDLQIQKRISSLLTMMLLLISILLLLMPEIVLIMGGKKYEKSLRAIPPIASSVFFMFLSTLVINVQYYYNKLIFSSLCSIVSIAFNLLLNITFVPIFGYVAAGYTTLASYGLVTIAEYFYTLNLLKKNGRHEAFDHKYIFILSICMLVAMLFSLVLYSTPTLRCLSLIIICVLVFIYKKQISKYIIQSLK